MNLKVSQEKIATVRDLQTKVSVLSEKIKAGGFFRVIRNKETLGFFVSPEYVEQIEDLQEDLDCLKSKYLAQKVAKARSDKKEVPLEDLL